MEFLQNLQILGHVLLLNWLLSQFRIDNVSGLYSFLNWGSQTFERKQSTASPNCVCGSDDNPSELVFKKWLIYIHVDLGDGRRRRCIGTILNSNMVLTAPHCFIKNDQYPVNIFELWQTNRSRIKDANKSTLITDPKLVFLQSGTTGRLFTTTKLIFREKFFQEFNFGKPYKALEYNTAIIITDKDFMNISGPESNFIGPICVPHAGEMSSKLLINQEAFYFGKRNWPENPDNDLTIATGTNFNYHISYATDCNQELKLGLDIPAQSELLCFRFVGPGPTLEGGPIRVNKNLFIEGGNRSSFLVGFGGFVNKGSTAEPNYVLFSNIDRHVKYLERIASQEGSEWCSTPPFQGDKWPWVGYKEKVEKSMDCDCGEPPPALQVEGRIAGGEAATPREFPWMVKLEIPAVPTDLTIAYKCTALLISDRVVLTAAHCMVEGSLVSQRDDFNVAKWGTGNDLLRIYLNSHLTGPDPKEFKVKPKRVIFHPGYVMEKRLLPWRRSDYDVALIILEQPVDITGQDPFIRPICLPEPGLLKKSIGKNATNAGWGFKDVRTDGSSADANTELQKLELPVRPMSDCFEYDLRHGDRNTQPTSTKICAGWLNTTKSSAPGDSGGPLMIKNEGGRFDQLGTVSYLKFDSRNSSDTESATYYGNVEEFLPFINYYSNLYGAMECQR